MLKQETNNKMNHRSLRQSIEQVDGKGGVHPVEKGKKQLTRKQGWSRTAEGMGGDGSVGGTSGNGGATKKRHGWLRWRVTGVTVASRGRQMVARRWQAAGVTMVSHGRQMVARDEEQVVALGQSNGAAVFVTKDTRKIEERRMAPADRSEKRTRSTLQTIDRTRSLTDRTR
jgi:hypothetical protein